MTSYPLLASGDIALFDMFLLHNLVISPGLQLRIVNSGAFCGEIEVRGGILGGRIGRCAGGIGVLGGGGTTRNYQH
ncbi:hypothetical protein [Candidatus Binatus sp.]|uniref:hypothetical protein n=1 Tax=Candidatus Binatus sp. TaxID=2811406 RepID=UPI003BAFE0D8